MRVALVGGGVVGLAVAWRLSAAGHRVEVFDDAPGQGASHAAAGMLAPAGEAWFGEDALVRLGAESLKMWPAFAAALERAADAEVGLRREGALLVGTDEADAADLRRAEGLIAGHGLACRRLTRRETRSREPALSPSAGRALLLADDLSVDNRRLMASLQRAARRCGARMHRDRADVVLGPDGAAAGVRRRSTGETHRADVCVVAAGHGLRDVAGVPAGVRAAVRPVKGQILRLRSHRPLLGHTVRARVRGEPVYAVPRADGEVVVGATSEELDDTTVTVDGVLEILRRAVTVVPALRDCELAEATARARPGTSDNGPLVGATTSPGLLVAGGHYRGGVLMAPVTAHAVQAVLDGEPPPAALAPFTADRFDRPAQPGPEPHPTARQGGHR